MHVLFCWFKGDFKRGALTRYALAISITFWGLILLAWLCYPTENKYSILTHTFSFLGSWQEKHSPQWWWIFSIALIFWGISFVPITCYIYRRFTTLTVWGARLGAFLLLGGCFAIILVGIFPDARGMVFGIAPLGEVHKWVAIFAAAAFILGIAWHGVLLIGDVVSARIRGIDNRLACKALLPPYLFWLVVLVTASYFLIKWEYVYAEMKAQAEATGMSIGSSWAEAMNTRYSFPLWENICIYTLFIFLVWFSVVLHLCEHDNAGR